MSGNFDYGMKPVPLRAVEIKGGFWHPRIETNRHVTLPLIYEKYKKRRWPSATWLEATAYSLTAHANPKLEKKVDAAINSIRQAQDKEGFINGGPKRLDPRERWSNLRDNHRLYGIGHLIEAAVAYHEATGKRRFLDVMRRCADHVATVFGPGKKQRRGYPGHEEIELALVRLYRATGESKYLALAKFFIDERGRQPHYFDMEAKSRGERPEDFIYKTYEYNQSHVPVREQRKAVGHAVRAMYLYCAMTDVAVLTNDKTLLNACRRLWRNVTQKRMHITGGIGPARSNEGFIPDYDLPNEGAYLETCAAIGLVFWAHRMLHAAKDARYADVMERALYNGTISGVSLDGKTFFYGNPLAAHPGFNGNGQFVREGFHYRRSEWFSCACCPPNIARLIAQVPRLVYSHATRAVYVHLYAESSAGVRVAGQIVEVAQKTDYPWSGRIRLSVHPERPATWTLAMRIPGWCRNARMKVNGKAVKVDEIVRKGYARIRRRWNKGDKVELVLQMPPERVEAHPAARHNCGRIALQRGPLVYCLEEADNGEGLNGVVLPRKARLAAKRDSSLPGAPVVITASGKRQKRDDWKDTLYRPAGAGMTPVTIKAVPYFMWANRKPGEMLVWMREMADGAAGRQSIAHARL